VSISRPVILMIEPGLGGGVERHVSDLVHLLRDQADFLRMVPAKGGLLRIRHGVAGYPAELFFDPVREIAQLVMFLRAVRIQRVHFHHTVRLPWSLSLLPGDLGVPYDYTAHDYFSFCPQITLTSEHFRYCGEPDDEGCNRCLSVRPTPMREDISGWRSRYRKFIEGAARVFVPTVGVGERLMRHFPEARIVLAPHPEPSVVQRAPVRISAGKGKLRIAVLGTLNPPKGADLLESCAQDATVRQLPIEFHLLGEAYRSLAQAPRAALYVHGPYKDAELDDLLAHTAPDLLWFPAQWPETYSYTLSAAMHLGYPIAATDIGAFHDRLAGRSGSWLLPWNTEARDWNDFFARLAARGQDDRMEAARLTPAAKSAYSYETDYLQVRAPIEPAATPKSNFLRFTRSWRARPGFLMDAAKEGLQVRLRHAYRLPGARRFVTALIPEYRLQRVRRWLDRF